MVGLVSHREEMVLVGELEESLVLLLVSALVYEVEEKGMEQEREQEQEMEREQEQEME